MIIRTEKTGNINDFQEIIYETTADEAVKGLVILACDANGFVPEDVDDILANVPIPLLGGIFPELIHGQTKLTKGSIVMGLLEEPNVQTIPNLSDPNTNY